AVHHLSELLLAEHHADAARALLTPYHQQWQQDVDTDMLLARSMVDSGDFEPAVDLLTEAIELTVDPLLLKTLQQQRSAAVSSYDKLLREHDQRNRLLTFYRRMAADDGGNSRYQLKQIELLIEMGQTTEASTLLQPLLFAEPVTAHAAEQLQMKIDRQLAREFTDTIKLTRLRNHFLVPLQIAGQRLMLLLDTGSSLTLVPTSIANSYPPEDSSSQITLTTANGRVSMPILVVPQLQLGQQTLQQVAVALTDNIDIPGADGLLGMNILKQFHFVIDQESATMRLTPRDTTPPAH
ncbi:MAG: aspartyl protease family protein, partial [Mariprofundales bacterium]|nr:aspartyl protease family protein [Mariprofundales bacterium]